MALPKSQQLAGIVICGIQATLYLAHGPSKVWAVDFVVFAYIRICGLGIAINDDIPVFAINVSMFKFLI